jgi:hypothetical protein
LFRPCSMTIFNCAISAAIMRFSLIISWITPMSSSHVSSSICASITLLVLTLFFS